jgi:SAM-dependent methyltransferase
MTDEDPVRIDQIFDLILDWSVLDHIREQYVHQYTQNIIDLLSPGGYLIAAEFNHDLPGIPEGQNHKIEDGHYSRAYSIEELQSVWKTLKLIDFIDGRLEDEINNYKLNTVLLKKTT